MSDKFCNFHINTHQGFHVFLKHVPSKGVQMTVHKEGNIPHKWPEGIFSLKFLYCPICGEKADE